MADRPYKRRRIAPTPVPDASLVSTAAMRSPYNRIRALEKKVRTIQKDKELKYLDTNINADFDATAEIPATGGQICLIGQGDDVVNRVGDKCTIKSVQVVGTITYSPGAGTLGATSVYLWVIQDTQANGAAASVTTVFTGTDMSQDCIRNMQYRQRYRTLGRMVFVLESKAGASGAYSKAVCPVNFYKKVNVPMVFSAGTAALTSIATNNIFLVAGSDGSTDDLVHLAGTARVTFTDGQ